MASRVTEFAALSGVLQALWDVVVWIWLVMLELFVTALLLAPRWVVHKLASLLRAGVRRLLRPFRLPRREHEPVQVGREGA
jgi:hypothetical protein